jgi:hypothetical protein
LTFRNAEKIARCERFARGTGMTLNFETLLGDTVEYGARRSATPPKTRTHFPRSYPE